MHIDVINGLLGAGKTTFLLNLLNQMPGNEKVAVLVNEFGEIGIDGDLLDGQGADVVELPNGCICCTLTADLRNQIRTIAETYRPDRLLIEPTGVATIKNLMGILRSLSLEKYIDDIRIILIVDAGMFQEILSQNRGFVEAQLEMAQVIVINKCDKVSSDEIERIQEVIRRVNNSGQIISTTFGRVLNSVITTRKVAVRKSFVHEHELPLKKYEQFGRISNGVFDIEKLRALFDQIKDRRFGPVDRAKGIFRLPDKWVRFDLAAHEINEVLTDREFKSSKIMVIGTQLQKNLLEDEFTDCQFNSGE